MRPAPTRAPAPSSAVRHRIPWLACALAISCAAPRSASRDGPAATGEPPALQLPGDVRPVRYALHLELDPSAPGFRGDEEIEIELAAPRRAIWMHARGLRVEEASVVLDDGAILPARLEQVTELGVSRLDLPRVLGPGHARIRVVWEGAWAGDAQGLFVSTSGADGYASSQFEAIGARDAFPCFDEPRFKTPFDVSLTVRREHVAVSNGPAVEERPAPGGGKTLRFETTRPLPTYLVFAAAGPFDVVAPPTLPPNEVRAWPVAVRGLAPRGRGGELAFALEASAAMIPWYERYFGIPYPYPKLDHVGVSRQDGAMENAGAISYANALLLVNAATSDRTRRAVAETVSHEIAHQWFGDLVTPGWWTEIWLNESFATWIGARAVDAFRPEFRDALDAAVDAERMKLVDGLPSAPRVRQPLASMDAVLGQFSPWSYRKGAALIGMVERWIGPETFRVGLGAYLRAHAHSIGSTDVLLRYLEAASERSIAPVLESFLDQPGLPIVSVRVDCDAKGARVSLGQRRWAPRGMSAPAEVWQIPVCLRWADGAGEHEGCAVLGRQPRTLPLGPACPAWVLPNAGSAGYYLWQLDTDELAPTRAAMARFPPTERIGIAHAVRAARRAGGVAAGEDLATVAALAADPDPAVARAALPLLYELRDLVPDPGVASYERFSRDLYGPVLARLGIEHRPKDSLDDRQLRTALVTFLSVTARDTAVLDEAAALGERLLDRPFASGIGDAGLAEAYLTAAVQKGGARTFSAIAGEVTPDLAEPGRSVALFALTRHDDRRLAEPLRELWARDQVTTEDRMVIWLDRDPVQRTARVALAQALDADFDRTASRFGPWGKRVLPGMVLVCGDRAQEQLERLFSSHLDAHPEMRREYDLAREQARGCEAERAADGPALARWLEARARRSEPQ